MEELILVKMSTLLRVIYRFLSNGTFHGNRKANLKLMETQKTLNRQSNSSRKKEAGGATLSDFKRYKVIVIETVQFWHKHRLKDKLKRIRRLEINLHIHSQLIWKKDTKNTQEKTVYYTNGTGKTGYQISQRRHISGQ